MVMKNIKALTQKQKTLTAARPLPAEVTRNLNEWLRVELTYTSNAIEGNTLSRAETAVVLEKGLTISGKPLKDHLEATNHAAAYDWVMSLIKKKTHQIDEATILEIHRLVLKGIHDDAAGQYRDLPVRIAGSTVILPNAAKVAALMKQLATWLASKPNLHPVELAAQAHYRLVTIHPFTDGNGRTARLLMNLILMQSGYPPAIIRPKDRLRYIRGLEQAQLGGSIDDFEDFIGEAAERSLDIYLKALDKNTSPIQMKPKAGSLIKIGELAKQTGETAATLRFWLKEGLIACAQRTESGYQLFDKTMIARAKQIRTLQVKRLTLSEISEKLIKADVQEE
ncbi:MAG: Fic family protein [Bdellovibrionales bacterium]|jgi:Fic family protein